MKIAEKSAEGPVASPTVNRIAESLEDRIRRGIYESGHWLPSERELATEFRVSRILVRAAIKEIERRELVACAAGCRPLVRGVTRSNGSAGPALLSRRSFALWIWPDPTWPGSMMIVKGVRHGLRADDFRLVLDSAIGDTHEALLQCEDRFLRSVSNDQDIDGVILWYLGAERNLPGLIALRQAGLPIVFLDRRPPDGFDADYVGVDNVRSAEHMVSHLIALGHRGIAHITNLDTASTTAERLQGYRRSLDRAQIAFRPELVIPDAGGSHDDHDPCGSLVDALLSMPDPPTAVFAVNDLVAYRIVASLNVRGVSIPGDISVAGFDGTDRSPGKPFLTTMRQPFERLGARAVELLHERIDSGHTAPYKHIVLDAPLYAGRSAGPANTRFGKFAAAPNRDL